HHFVLAPGYDLISIGTKGRIANRTGVAHRRGDRGTIRGIPNPGRSVVARRENLPAIGAEFQKAYRARMVDRKDFSIRPQLPQTHSPVFGRYGHPVSVPAKTYGRDGCRLFPSQGQVTRAGIPKIDHIRPENQNVAPVRAEKDLRSTWILLGQSQSLS